MLQDKLIEQRKKFDSLYKQASKIKDSSQRKGQEERLVELEREKEFLFRAGFVRGLIVGKGYQNYMEEIIDGLNISANKVFPFEIIGEDENYLYGEPAVWPVRDYSRRIRAAGDCQLMFAVEYINRWVMYFNLFSGEEYA